MFYKASLGYRQFHIGCVFAECNQFKPAILIQIFKYIQIFE